MISDSGLQKVSFVVSVAGIVAILAVAFFLAPEQISTGDAGSHMGKIVTITGYVTSLSVHQGNVFMTLDDGSGGLKVVMFSKQASTQNVYDISEGDKISVSGKISSYRGETELIAEDIRTI